MLGRVLIVHDADGEPYGCATIEPDVGRTPLYTTSFVPYLNYEGPLHVSGTVSPLITQAKLRHQSARGARQAPCPALTPKPRTSDTST
jgi:hypothetical protein